MKYLILGEEPVELTFANKLKEAGETDFTRKRRHFGFTKTKQENWVK